MSAIESPTFDLYRFTSRTAMSAAAEAYAFGACPHEAFRMAALDRGCEAADAGRVAGRIASAVRRVTGEAPSPAGLRASILRNVTGKTAYPIADTDGFLLLVRHGVKTNASARNLPARQRVAMDRARAARPAIQAAASLRSRALQAGPDTPLELKAAEIAA